MSATTTRATRLSFLRRMLTAPVFEGHDHKTRIARLLHIILLALASVILIFATLEILVSGIGIVLVATEVTGLVYFCLWIVMRRGHVKLVSIITASLFLISTTVLIYFTGTIRTPITAFYIVGVVLAGLLLGNRGTLIFTVLSLLALGDLIQLEIAGRLPPAPVEPVSMSQWFTYAGILAIVAVLLSLSATSLNQALARARANEQSLSQSNRELQALRNSLEERVAERTAQLRASGEVGRAAASILDTNQLLRQTVNLITDRFGFYYAAIFTLDSPGKWAVLREGTGEAGRILKERGHRLEVGGQSMVGAAAKTLEPQIALRVGAATTRFANPLLPDTQSEIALPLVVGNRVLGALDVQSTQAEAFDENNAAVLQSMADQIAVALSNSAQFEQTQIALQRTQHLYEASAAIAEADDAQGVLKALIEQAAPEADLGILITYGPKNPAGYWSFVEVTASWIRDEYEAVLQPGAYYTVEQLPFIKSISPAQPLIIRDVAQLTNDPSSRSVMEDLHIKAALGVALTTGTIPIGALFITYREPRPLTPGDVQSLQALAGQVASVIYNQRLIQETQTALKQLDDINRRLTGEAWREFARSTAGVRQIDLAPGVLIDDTAGPPPALIEAPVMLRDEAIGVLRLEDTAPDRVWTPDERALLEAVAGELAIAIENQRLIEQTEKRAQRERLVAEISNKMFAQNNLESIVEIAATELGRALHFSRAEVRIGSEALTTATPQLSTERGNGHQQEAQA